MNGASEPSGSRKHVLHIKSTFWPILMGTAIIRLIYEDPWIQKVNLLWTDTAFQLWMNCVILPNIIHWLRALPVCAQWSMTALISDCCVCTHWIKTGNPGIFCWVQPFMPVITRSALRSTDTSGTIMDDATFKAHFPGALCDSEIIKNSKTS